MIVVADEQIRALLVFPSLDNALELRAQLTNSSGDSIEFVFYRAERADEAIRRIARDEYHVVIADMNLPDSDGPEFVKRLRQAAPRIPVVMVSDADGDDMESALAAVEAGAQDCILRQSVDTGAIYRGVRFAIERARQFWRSLEPQFPADRDEGSVSVPILTRIAVADNGDLPVYHDTAGWPCG